MYTFLFINVIILCKTLVGTMLYIKIAMYTFLFNGTYCFLQNVGWDKSQPSPYLLPVLLNNRIASEHKPHCLSTFYQKSYLEFSRLFQLTYFTKMDKNSHG